jgi:hypothetical protein
MAKTNRRLTKDEILFIEQNASSMTDEEIANRLGRAAVTIVKYRKRAGIDKTKGRVETSKNQSGYRELGFEDLEEDEKRGYIRTQLENSSDYQKLRDGILSPTELRAYADSYVNYIMQFKSDLKATEYTQVGQVCRYEILLDRNLSDKKYAMKQIVDMEDEIARERKIIPPDLAMINMLQTNIEIVKEANVKRGKEYLDTQRQHGALLKDLKATRDQRIQKIEDTKTSFFDLIKALMDHEYQEKESREMELVRIATSKETKHLSEYHTYVDGEVDRPILNEHTVGEDDD